MSSLNSLLIRSSFKIFIQAIKMSKLPKTTWLVRGISRNEMHMCVIHRCPHSCFCYRLYVQDILKKHQKNTKKHQPTKITHPNPQKTIIISVPVRLTLSEDSSLCSESAICGIIEIIFWRKGGASRLQEPLPSWSFWMNVWIFWISVSLLPFFWPAEVPVTQLRQF